MALSIDEKHGKIKVKMLIGPTRYVILESHFPGVAPVGDELSPIELAKLRNEKFNVQVMS